MPLPFSFDPRLLAGQPYQGQMPGPLDLTFNDSFGVGRGMGTRSLPMSMQMEAILRDAQAQEMPRVPFRLPAGPRAPQPLPMQAAPQRPPLNAIDAFALEQQRKRDAAMASAFEGLGSGLQGLKARHPALGSLAAMPFDVANQFVGTAQQAMAGVPFDPQYQTPPAAPPPGWREEDAAEVPPSGAGMSGQGPLMSEPPPLSMAPMYSPVQPTQAEESAGMSLPDRGTGQPSPPPSAAPKRKPRNPKRDLATAQQRAGLARMRELGMPGVPMLGLSTNVTPQPFFQESKTPEFTMYPQGQALMQDAARRRRAQLGTRPGSLLATSVEQFRPR